MKRFFGSLISALFLVFLLPATASATELLIPGGKLVGLTLCDDTLTVAAYDDSCGSAARDAGLKIGDEILKVDGTPVSSAEDVRNALDGCASRIELIVARGNKQHRILLSPNRTNGRARLGVYLRSGIAGIGTITYYDPETHIFGALGHGVSNSQGTLLTMTSGNAYSAAIESITKGKCGTPGQLRGAADVPAQLGTLKRNTPCGVFGIAKNPILGEALPVAAYDQIQTGEATIRATVSSEGVREYSVEILKIYPEARADNRNFLLKVTDKDLLEATGGIVQGMSGSPIIQNGKLIGAVTHVLVNDPTTGYGIFIENMLSAAG